jgi:hypothetical protein
MTYVEFSKLRRSEGDLPSVLPITPDQLMSNCLYRLDELIKKSKESPEDIGVIYRLAEIKFVLSIQVNDDGTVLPTHYYD